MKFKIIVAADDNSEVDYSVEYLFAADAKKFIDGWQKLQDEAPNNASSGRVCTCAEQSRNPYYAITCEFCGLPLPTRR